MLWDTPYIIEILTPKKGGRRPVQEEMESFACRYEQALSSGCAVSIPDNPLGKRRYTVLETFDYLGLQADTGKTLINLNTFHSKDELDFLLQNAASKGLCYVLVVRGDGSPELPKLQPRDLEVGVNMVTSVELLRYINTRYSGTFRTGAAFNQYKPESVERAKLAKKKSSGASFLVVQPVVGKDSIIADLMEEDIPVVLEAWMSPRIDLFVKSAKVNMSMSLDSFDPVKNLETLHELYPKNCVYLSMLHSISDWQAVLPRL